MSVHQILEHFAWSFGAVVCAFVVLGAFICAERTVGAEDMWRPKL